MPTRRTKKTTEKFQELPDESEEEFQSLDEEASEDFQANKKANKKKQGVGKKRKQSVKNKFFQIEADEGDESENEHKGANQLAKDAYYDPTELKRRNIDYSQKLLQMEERAKLQEERKAKKDAIRQQSDQEPESDDDGLKSEEDSQGEKLSANELERRENLPSISDPKLWQVRVRKGMERIAAMALMNKMIDYTQKGKPFAILSATFVENLENYIFVEAYKIESVYEAISGLAYVFRRIDILPINEMTKIYEDQDSKLVRPKQGQWVRIRNGLYQDDLG